MFRIFLLNWKLWLNNKKIRYSLIFSLSWFAFWKPISDWKFFVLSPKTDNLSFINLPLKKSTFSRKKICPVLFLPKNYLVLLAYSDRYLIYTLWGTQLRKLHKFEIFSWRKLNSHKTWLKTSLHVCYQKLWVSWTFF